MYYNVAPNGFRLQEYGDIHLVCNTLFSETDIYYALMIHIRVFLFMG